MKTIAGTRRFAEREALERELADALEQQATTSEILRVISRSASDVQPVFDTIATAARRLCQARSANVLRLEAGQLRLIATAVDDARAEAALRTIWPREVGRDTAAGRAVLARQVVAVVDVLADSEYGAGSAAVEAGYRSALGVPLLREGVPIGAITIGRPEPGPFPASQVALLRTFGDQAVIAIENVRLFNETKDALARQTATAEVLRVISGSVTDVQPVFDVIAERAARLTGAKLGWVFTFDGEWIRSASAYGLDPQALRAAQKLFPMRPSGASYTSCAIRDGVVMNVADALAETDPEYATKPIAVQAGYRSVLSVPMFRGGEVLGAISVNRAETGRFADKEVELLRTFADQAVIAIENGRLFKELQDKSRELEIASRHKSAFLANMSHELRTPMNAIIGFTRLVMRNAPPQMPARQLDNLHKILGSAQHLLTLINATLDLSRIEAGRIRIDAADVALGPLLEDCLRTVEPLLGNDVRMRLKRGPAPPELHVDEAKLRQIVINLLSNAAKFTEHGAIELRARVRGDRVEVAVLDTGIGIPADKLEAVFEEFEQVDAGSTRAHGGTGLGLAIARRLARAMGGELSAHSTLGAGSTFTLELPLRWRGADEA